MKTPIQQAIAYLERKEASEKCRLAQEARHLEDSTFTKGRLSMLRVILTDARRAQEIQQKPVQHGASKRKNREGGRATGEV